MSSYYELHIPQHIPKKRRTAGIEWTNEMIATLRAKFPVTFNKELADELGVGWRTLVRKARELGLEKEPGFLDIRRKEITEMAKIARPENPTKGQKGWTIPGGEKHQFKKGHIPATKTNPELVERIRSKRNATIKDERSRLKIGLKPLTKLNLKNY